MYEIKTKYVAVCARMIIKSDHRLRDEDWASKKMMTIMMRVMIAITMVTMIMVRGHMLQHMNTLHCFEDHDDDHDDDDGDCVS